MGFAKGIISHAADFQKQSEALVQEFGPAADIVSNFAEKSGTKLGISAHAAETTANRFGLLFTSLGIGQKQAATMTVNMEELGGAISQIRNIDPASVFATLPLALGGNIRALRQMGIATTVSMIKLRAEAIFGKDAIVGALTPTQKAIAVYQIATDQLNKRLQEAQAHSGDLANITRRLGAEWDNQKDKIGARLLPVMVKLGALAERILPGAFAGLTTSVGAFVSVIQKSYSVIDGITKPFGGAKKAIEAFVIALTVKKIADFVIGLGKVRTEAEEVQLATAKSVGNIEKAMTGFSSTAAVVSKNVGQDFATMTTAIKTDMAESVAAVRTGTSELSNVRVVSPSQARQQRIAQLPTGNTFQGGSRELRSSTGRFSSVRPAFSEADAKGTRSFFLAAQRDSNQLAGNAERNSGKIRTAFRSAFSGLGSFAQSGAKAASTAVSGIGSLASTTVEKTATGFRGLFTGIKAGAIAMADGVKAAFISAIPILALTIVIQLLIEHFDTVKKVAFAVVYGIVGAWRGAKDVLIGVAEIIGGAMATYLTAPLRIFLEALSHVTGILDKIGIHIGGEVKGALSALKSISTSLFSEGVSQAAKGGQEIAAAFTGAWNREMAKHGPGSEGSNVADPFVKPLQDLQGKLHSVNDAITNGVKANNTAVDSARRHLADLGRSLADAVKQEAQDIQDAVESAKSNLFSLASTLENSIGQILDAPIQAAQSRISRLSNLQSLQQLRQSVLLPGGKELSSDPTKALAELRSLANRAGGLNKEAIQSFIIQYQQASLAVKQDNVNLTKESTQRRITDLADALNKGQITLGQFRKGVLGIIKKDKLPYAEAGRLLGQSFMDGFNQQTKDLFAQALEVARAPKTGHATTGFAQQIVKPLQTLHDDQQKIAQINRDIRAGEASLRHAEAQRAAKLLAEQQKQTKLHAQQLQLLQQIKAIEARRAAFEEKHKPQPRKIRNLSPAVDTVPHFSGSRG